MLLFSLWREREYIERADGGAERPLGKMQIDRRFLKVAMSKQHLDGAQVGAAFQQMRREAMAQCVGMKVSVLQTGAFGSVPAEIEDRAIAGHWEGDLLAGTKNSHIATLVERHSRFTMLIKVPAKTQRRSSPR